MNQVELYAENNVNQRRDAEILMGEYKDRFVWGENETALDIGCGPGDVTAEVILPVLPKSAHLVGSDVLEEMIVFARKHFESERLSFKTMDIAADNVTDILGNETFDKVFSFYCLHWIKDQRKLVENIWKLMKPNGTAFVAFVSYSPLMDLYKCLSEQPKWKEYMLDLNKYVIPYQYEENGSEIFKNHLRSVGFDVIECYDKNVELSSRNLKSLRKSLEAINPFVGRMPLSMQTEFMESIMKMALDKGYVKTLAQINDAIENERQPITDYTPHRLIVALFKK